LNHLYQDKVALVTGASSGIGWAIARELAREGATVVAVARRKERLDRLASEIVADGGRAEALACDVTSETAVKEMAAQVKSRLGQLHLLVNCAGQEMMMPLAVTKIEAARSLMDANTLSVAIVIKSCLGLLKKGSAVVNVSSALALKGTATMSIYSATKGAIIAMTRSLAVELAPRGIRVNAVAPGMVRTDLLDRLFRGLKEEQIAAIEAKHPLGFGRPEDVADAVAFLGSDKAAWITGQALVVDGGLTA
jgi:NAD(P)-dependent dehydrogenase (short-subunit alcohol dehydrogenase family)